MYLNTEGVLDDEVVVAVEVVEEAEGVRRWNMLSFVGGIGDMWVGVFGWSEGMSGGWVR